MNTPAPLTDAEIRNLYWETRPSCASTENPREMFALISRVIEAEVNARWQKMLDVVNNVTDAQAINAAEFLSLRLGRVARIAGVKMPDGMSHFQIAECAGTILGDVARKLEDHPAPDHTALLRQALEALEYHTAQTRPIQQTMDAITALKEALK